MTRGHKKRNTRKRRLAQRARYLWLWEQATVAKWRVAAYMYGLLDSYEGPRP